MAALLLIVNEPAEASPVLVRSKSAVAELEEFENGSEKLPPPPPAGVLKTKLAPLYTSVCPVAAPVVLILLRVTDPAVKSPATMLLFRFSFVYAMAAVGLTFALVTLPSARSVVAMLLARFSFEY